jgi:divalent metal cation (Fe/Co/Zn/Cd) transporter
MDVPVTAGGAPEESRSALVRYALRLERATIAWMVIEAGVALGAGVAAHSLTLSAFGMDSLIELLSAGVLLWRLTHELRDGKTFDERIERRASRLGGALLFLLTMYIVVGVAFSLWTRRAEQWSVPGLVIACCALPVMTLLAREKLKIAGALHSRSLRTDAIESVTCGWLSLVVVVGVLTNYVVGAWWIDAVTALGIAGFVLKEAREAWNDASCCEAAASF